MAINPNQAGLFPGGGGHFNFVCTGVCGHRIEKLTHPQTKVGLSVNQNTPIPRLFTTEIEQQTTIGFIQLRRNPPIPRLNYIKIMTHPQVFGQKFTSIRRFLAWKTHPFWSHIPNMTQYGSAPQGPIFVKYRLGPLCFSFVCGPITTKLGMLVLWDKISQNQ